MKNDIKRVFIGGTGRSGTSIARHLFYLHGQLYVVPIESKFIVEVDGLAELAEALTNRFSVTNALEAQARFFYLMREIMSGKKPRAEAIYFSPAVYPPQPSTLKDLFENYQEALGAFASEIGASARYFPDRAILIAAMRKLVDGLFEGAAHKLQKAGWCEKTPSNLMNLPFLWELFPDSIFIHMKRDPRGVMDSLKRKNWAPADLRKNAQSVGNVLGRWRDIKNGLDLTKKNYLEVKLEDLALNTDKTMETIFQAAGLDRIQPQARSQFRRALANYWKVDLGSSELEAQVNPWKSNFSPQEIAIANDEIGDLIAFMGYEP